MGRIRKALSSVLSGAIGRWDTLQGLRSTAQLASVTLGGLDCSVVAARLHNDR